MPEPLLKNVLFLSKPLFPLLSNYKLKLNRTDNTVTIPRPIEFIFCYQTYDALNVKAIN